MVKNKLLKSVQTSKRIKRQFSAGGAVFRRDEERDLWLVIKPSGKDTWRLPKGLIERGENSLSTAIREVEEEGGIEVEVIGKVGLDKIFYKLGGQNFYKTVIYYLMEYKRDSKNPISWETDKIEWLPFEEALERLTYEGEKKILKEARSLLAEEAK